MKLVNYWEKYTEMHGQQSVKNVYLYISEHYTLNKYLFARIYLYDI